MGRSIVGATRLIKHLIAKKKAADESQGGNKTKRKYKAYRRRNTTLSDLGYVAYKQYLDSEEWGIIRTRKLERFPCCLVCRDQATQVHHMDYEPETLLGLKTHNLVTLCARCHEEIEIAGDGTKRSLAEANRQLRMMAQANKRTTWLEAMKDATKRDNKPAQGLFDERCNDRRKAEPKHLLVKHWSKLCNSPNLRQILADEGLIDPKGEPTSRARTQGFVTACDSSAALMWRKLTFESLMRSRKRQQKHR